MVEQEYGPGPDRDPFSEAVNLTHALVPRSFAISGAEPDAYDFCSPTPVPLRIRSVLFAVSSQCLVNALIAAGDVSKSYVQARRRGHH